MILFYNFFFVWGRGGGARGGRGGGGTGWGGGGGGGVVTSRSYSQMLVIVMYSVKTELEFNYMLVSTPLIKFVNVNNTFTEDTYLTDND